MPDLTATEHAVAEAPSSWGPSHRIGDMLTTQDIQGIAASVHPVIRAEVLQEVAAEIRAMRDRGRDPLTVSVLETAYRAIQLRAQDAADQALSIAARGGDRG